MGQVNFTHATRAKLGANLVTANPFTRGERQCTIRGRFLGSTEASGIVDEAARKHKKHRRRTEIFMSLLCLFVASKIVIEEADEFGEIDVAAGDDADDLAEWCVG